MKRVAAIIWLALALPAAGGCDTGLAAVGQVHPPLGQRKVETLEAAFQFAKVRKLELAMARQWRRPGGEAAPDFEYYYIVVPDSGGKYTIGDRGTTVYRLVRQDGHETLYRAVGGRVDYSFGFLTHARVHATFDVSMERVWSSQDAGPGAPEPQEAQEFKGDIKAWEDMRVCQGLINKYQGDVVRLEHQAKAARGEIPAAEPGKPDKSKRSKKSKTPATETRSDTP